MEQMITCISCPIGCRMTVKLENGAVVSVNGNTCIRGDRYARQEAVDPQRMVTAVIPVAGSAVPLSVKTRTPVPKRLIDACMQALADVRISAPVHAGDVIVADVCGCGVDVIATRSLEA